MGRRKIAIEKIENRDKRYVTFSKRRQGLFKKAAAACSQYGLQIGMVVFSPAGKPFVFSNSSSVDSIIDRFMSDSSSVGKRSRSDEEVNETAEKKKKRETTPPNSIRGEEKEETEKDQGFDSDHQTDHQELTNEFMGFGENVKKITEEIMESQGSEEEEETNVAAATTCNQDSSTTWNMNEFLGFDSSLLLPPSTVAAAAVASSSSSSSEFLVEGDNYSWPSDIELQELLNMNGFDNDADHHPHHDENMCLLPPHHAPPPTSSSSLCNLTSYMNQDEEVGGDEDGLTLEEWELLLST